MLLPLEEWSIKTTQARLRATASNCLPAAAAAITAAAVASSLPHPPHWATAASGEDQRVLREAILVLQRVYGDTSAARHGESRAQGSLRFRLGKRGLTVRLGSSARLSYSFPKFSFSS